MRRRRILRRASLRPASLQPLGPRVRTLLLRAHQLQATGQHLAAAQLFEQLAEGAQKRSLPQAPQLQIQAARAYLLAGEKEKGISNLTAAFDALIQEGHEDRILSIAPRIQRFLHTNQLDDVWHVIHSMLQEHNIVLDPAFISQPNALRLPSKCPYCGGTLNPSEVEHTAGGGVVCLYCGSVVQGDE